MSTDQTMPTEESEATRSILTSTDRRFRDRISGDTLLILYDWCASGPDRKVWPDEDVRMKVIENGMLLEFQPNELCCGWESLKGTNEEAGLRLKGSKIDRFREFFWGSGLRGLRDFGEEELRKFMIKYQDWLLPLLDEDEKQEFTSKIDGVIEFLSDKMKMKDTLVYMGWMARDHGFKGSLVFVHTKDDASPALLLLAHGVVPEDKPNYVYIGHYPHAHNIDSDDADAADSDSDDDDNDASAEESEDDDDNYICIGDAAHDVDPPTLADNIDAGTILPELDLGPVMPPERMDPYLGSLVVSYVDSDVESSKEAEDVAEMEEAEDIAGMESNKELYYIQATISYFDVDASKKRRVD